MSNKTMNPETHIHPGARDYALATPAVHCGLVARLKLLLEPGRVAARLPVLAAEPLIQHLQAGLWLVVWDHVTGLVQPQEGKVSRRLDLPNLLLTEHVWSQLFTVESLLALPLESVGPGLVSEPVADKVGITSIDQDWDLLEDLGNELLEWKHPISPINITSRQEIFENLPVAVEQKVPVDVKVATLKAADLGS